MRMVWAESCLPQWYERIQVFKVFNVIGHQILLSAYQRERSARLKFERFEEEMFWRRRWCLLEEIDILLKKTKKNGEESGWSGWSFGRGRSVRMISCNDNDNNNRVMGGRGGGGSLEWQGWRDRKRRRKIVADRWDGVTSEQYVFPT